MEALPFFCLFLVQDNLKKIGSYGQFHDTRIVHYN